MGITVATTRVACNTSTGNQDISTTDLGGLPPKAALFIVSNAVTDGTAADGSVLSYGAATSVIARWAISVTSKHGVTTTLTNTLGLTTGCVYVIDPADGTTVDGQADFVSFIANGVRINWSNAPAAAYLMTVVLFAGTDLTAQAGSTALGNTIDLTTDITTVGFQPDLVLTAIIGTLCRHSFGMVHETGGTVRQYSYGGVSRNGQTTTGEFAHVRSDAGVAQLSTSGTASWYGEFSAFDSSGFSVTSRVAGTGNQTLNWLALDFNGAAGVWVGNHSTPTATGNASDTQPGFRPQFILQLQTLAEAVTTIYSDSRGGSIGIAAIDVNEAYTTSLSREDAVTTSNTQSLSDNVAVRLPDDDGAAKLTATLTSFDATGWTANYSAVDAAVKLFPTLVIGESVDVSGTQGRITIATMRGATNTSIGNQDFTTTDMGGFTPKAALFIMTSAITDNTAINGATIGFGAAISVAKQWSGRVHSRHGGVGNSVTNGTQSITTCISLYNHSDSVNAGSAEFVSFIQNGVRINWTTAPTAAFLLTIVFFSGENLLATIGSISVGDTLNLETDNSAVGFRPDVVITMMAFGDGRLSVGIIQEDGAGTVSQAAMQCRSTNSLATTSEGLYMRTDAGAIEIQTSTALDWYAEFSGFDDAGFSVTTRNAGGNSRAIRFIAFKFGPDLNTWVGTHTTPTATGDKVETGPGFKPQFLFQLQTLAEAVSTAYTDARGGSVALGVATALNSYSNSHTKEDAVTTSNTQSLSDDQLLRLPNHDGAALLAATLVNMNSNGWTANYSAVDAAEKLFPTLAIEAVAVGPPLIRSVNRIFRKRRIV